VEKADQLAVLSRGAIVEFGTPGNLRDSGGAYARLVEAGETVELAGHAAAARLTA
jgi:ATP-binding cassette, subfamily B, bacterial